MGNWDGVPAKYRPTNPEDVETLEAILRCVIEAQAIEHDFIYAQSVKAGERRLPNKTWKSKYALGRDGPFQPSLPPELLSLEFVNLALDQGLIDIAPPQKWNAKIKELANHAKELAGRLKSAYLKNYLLANSKVLPIKKIDFMFWGVDATKRKTPLRLERPGKYDGWYVPGRPDRMIRYLLHLGPGPST